MNANVNITDYVSFVNRRWRMEVKYMLDVNKPYNDLPYITSLDFTIPERIKKLAEDTRVSIGILNYAIKSLPSPNILLDTLALQEAKISSNIENIVTTNDDLYKGVIFKDYTAESKEVSNYKDALFIGYGAFKSKGLISLSDTEKINERVNKKQKGIRANLSQFDSLTRIANIKNGVTETIYTPPHGKDLLQKLLIDMFEYVYDNDTYDVHPLIKIALAHYQFESIHPFYDGNGRTGRILNILFLCQQDYLEYPILYASSYIIKNKNEYYDILRTTKENNDYIPVIEYMLNSFMVTAKKTLSIVENIKQMLSKYKDESFINGLKGQRVLLLKTIDLVFTKAYIRVRDLVDEGVHRQTAAMYLDQLVDNDILIKEKIGKENIYKNVKLLSLFETEINDNE